MKQLILTVKAWEVGGKGDLITLTIKHQLKIEIVVRSQNP